MTQATLMQHAVAAGRDDPTTLHTRRFSDANQYFTIDQGVVKNVTVPEAADGEMVAFFNVPVGISIWVLPSDTPVLTAPTGAITDTKAQLNPQSRIVKPGQTLQLLMTTVGAGIEVGIEYYNQNKLVR